MSKLTLSYFDLPSSRGEECRLALTLAGAEFVDDRIAYQDWPSRKPEMPFGAVPVLTVPDRGALAHSNAILIYIGSRFGLRPTDPFEAAKHDGIMEAVEEIRIKTWEVLRKGTNDEEKKALRLEFAEGPLMNWASALEKQVRGPFSCGEALQVADLKIWSICHWFGGGVIDHIPTDILAKHEKLSAIHRAVGEDPRVAAFRAKHVK